MSYDPIINYYDKPGGPSIPGSDSGSGGGGGEAKLGSMQNLMLFNNTEPHVGAAINITVPSNISDVYVGSQHVIGPVGEGENVFYNKIGVIASGARVTYTRDFSAAVGTATDDINAHVYVTTIEVEAAGTPDESEEYTSVRESDVEPSLTVLHDYDDGGYSYYTVFVTITQPELSDADERLVCYVSVSE